MIFENLDEFKEYVDENGLNGLYRLITGNTQLDVEAVAEEIASLDEPEKTEAIGKFLFNVPGGTGVNDIVSEFKTMFYEAVGGVVADVDGDGDVDQDDYDAVKAGQDITGDDKVDQADLDLVKALSTAEIEEIGDDEPVDEGSDEEDVEE